jgi:hypothetical protein
MLRLLHDGLVHVRQVTASYWISDAKGNLPLYFDRRGSLIAFAPVTSIAAGLSIIQRHHFGPRRFEDGSVDRGGFVTMMST